MLTLFTNITEQLTDLEKTTLAPQLIAVLQRYSPQRITGKQLCHHLRSLGYDVSEVRLRKMVNYIRVTNATAPQVLIGGGNGYFLSADIKTVDDQIESLQGRIDSMNCALDAIKAQRLNLVNETQCGVVKGYGNDPTALGSQCGYHKL